ncbi:hypothetical protein CEE37_13745 [candidate division LCP-89 bacterium B3_LCP]|uniref:DUF72 domain-containing protein n=1 Tax=candidate division LCP-89 bacterium B3_LCP TaxID=2012998 RepID=A0A532URM3_UNCL8|nr:MAG: hypothetical protein CEE37_13745 [candidate division LCP-89 bacterium B3_LCP]
MNRNAAQVEIGTSGYSFKDWVGPFYPAGTPPDKLLEFYARQFSVVEINTTYYGIPKSSVFEGMAEQVNDNFGFYVKVHQDVTHTREEPEKSIKYLQQSVEPLRDRGMLRGFLAQFPYSFKKNPATREYMVRLADCWAGYKEPLFVEYRHTSWFKPIVYESLTNHNLGFVNVDLPELPRLPMPSAEVTNGEGYIRMHGRNKDSWWGNAGDPRYNYNYNKAELKGWKGRVTEMAKKANRIIIFMNNCHQGQAVKNAKMLQNMFDEF